MSKLTHEPNNHSNELSVSAEKPITLVDKLNAAIDGFLSNNPHPSQEELELVVRTLLDQEQFLYDAGVRVENGKVIVLVLNRSDEMPTVVGSAQRDLNR